jgi:hypothetical protein
MNIENKIQSNKSSFDDVKMPVGSRARFEERLRREAGRYVRRDDIAIQKLRIMTWTSVAAAAITVFMVISGIFLDGRISTKSPQVAENKLVTMRQFYDEKMDEAIMNLEVVMQNVDDSTRMQINAVIDGLTNMGDIFAEMAPLPEEKQMAIAEQMYDSRLKTIELITEKINK